jgi:DNA helicase-2/ATP-dependent DNA helicase PcrA
MVDKSLAAYLQQITLLTDADQKDPDADTVKLMTIHAAKGLEFGCVFAAGLEEMLFPMQLQLIQEKSWKKNEDCFM